MKTNSFHDEVPILLSPYLIHAVVQYNLLLPSSPVQQNFVQQTTNEIRDRDKARGGVEPGLLHVNI